MTDMKLFKFFSLTWIVSLLAYPLISIGVEQKSITVSNRNDLIQAIRNASPGAKILIAPGDYRGGLSFSQLKGTAKKPIVIQAQEAKNPPVIRGGPSGVHFKQIRYVQFRNVVISDYQANGLNIDDGGDSSAPSQHVTLDGIQVINKGLRGNKDGIKLSGINDFIVKNCLIKGWGDYGSAIDMVGCQRGVIQSSQFIHSGVPGANGVQTKGGSRDIKVQHCRFEKAGGRGINIGGSTGLAYFRPKPQGFEAKNITVEDNLFIETMPVAYVGVDGAQVRHNTVYLPQRWVMRILQENQREEFVSCRKGVFEKNIIVFQFSYVRTAVNVGSKTQPKTFKIQENFWYALDRPNSTSRITRTFPVSEKNGKYGEDPQFKSLSKKDFSLKKGSAAKGYGVRPKQRR